MATTFASVNRPPMGGGFGSLFKIIGRAVATGAKKATTKAITSRATGQALSAGLRAASAAKGGLARAARGRVGKAAGRFARSGANYAKTAKNALGSRIMNSKSVTGLREAYRTGGKTGLARKLGYNSWKTLKAAAPVLAMQLALEGVMAAAAAGGDDGETSAKQMAAATGIGMATRRMAGQNPNPEESLARAMARKRNNELHRQILAKKKAKRKKDKNKKSRPGGYGVASGVAVLNRKKANKTRLQKGGGLLGGGPPGNGSSGYKGKKKGVRRNLSLPPPTKKKIHG